MRVFVSHASEDERVARGVAVALRECGVEVWIAQERIQVADSIPEEIEEALRTADHVVVLISRAAVRSPWVQREWRAALHRELSSPAQPRLLLPARLDDGEVPELLRDRRLADFRPGFLEGFCELLGAIRGALLAEHAARSGVVVPRSADGELEKILGEALACCERGAGLPLVHLLNTLLRGQLRRGAVPPWLVGRWRSVAGWGAARGQHRADVLTCSATPHGLYSNIADGHGIASFGGDLRLGYVAHLREISEGVVAFRWGQETGGTMSGATFDAGFGFWLADDARARMRGLWWYDLGEGEVASDAARGRAYAWALARIGEERSADG